MTVKGTTLTMVHPHTSDQPDDFGDNGEDIVDLWYGTTEPLSRVWAGETLIFYDPESEEGEPPPAADDPSLCNRASCGVSEKSAIAN